MKKINILVLAVFLVGSSLQSLHAQDQAQSPAKNQISFEVIKYQLKNGLTVLIHPDRSMPLLSFQQWFRVGSANEKPGRTGLAHFFEHLMFKGTTKYPKGIIDRIIDSNGGAKNAFTTEDVTGYYTDLPASKLELIMDVESDRMRNLILDQKEIDSEREVVKEERRMRYENSVIGSLLEKIRTTMYKTGPYHWPVIGYMEDLNAAKMEEFQTFYRQYYAPNNAVIVIAGDVDVEKTKKLVEKYYGAIPSQTIPEFKPIAEAEQKSPRRARLEKDVQNVTLTLTFPTPGSQHVDSFALDILAAVLGSGTSSRLYKNLVYNKQLATQSSASNSTDKLAGQFMIYAALKPGVSDAQVLPLFNAEVKKIQDQLISDTEIKKIKKGIKLSYLKGLQTISSRAEALAEAETVHGNYQKVFSDLDNYEKVTAEDLQRVARKYLVPSKQNIVQVVPKAQSAK